MVFRAVDMAPVTITNWFWSGLRDEKFSADEREPDSSNGGNSRSSQCDSMFYVYTAQLFTLKSNLSSPSDQIIGILILARTPVFSDFAYLILGTRADQRYL